MESGPWTIVHGIDTQACQKKWTMDYSPWYQKLNTDNRNWIMDYETMELKAE